MTIDANPYKHDSECTEACPACRWRMGEMKKQLDSPEPYSPKLFSPEPYSPCPDCGEWGCHHWCSLTAHMGEYGIPAKAANRA